MSQTPGGQALAGWLFVAAQAALLLALVLIDGRDDWPTPALLTTIAAVLVLSGFAVIAIASLRLGAALTPTPVPSRRGELTTSGLYQFVRHPIYSGVLAIVAGITLRSGSVIHLAIAAVTFVFFDRKARWEEARLAETYAGYGAYVNATPRFFPSKALKRQR